MKKILMSGIVVVIIGLLGYRLIANNVLSNKHLPERINLYTSANHVIGGNVIGVEESCEIVSLDSQENFSKCTYSYDIIIEEIFKGDLEQGNAIKVITNNSRYGWQNRLEYCEGKLPKGLHYFIIQSKGLSSGYDGYFVDTCSIWPSVYSTKKEILLLQKKSDT